MNCTKNNSGPLIFEHAGLEKRLNSRYSFLVANNKFDKTV